MRARTITTALACVLIVGCAPSRKQDPPCEPQPPEVEVSVCVDSAFDDAERAAAHAACDAWTAATCGLITLRPLAVPGDAPPSWCDVTVLQPRGELATHACPGAVSALAPTVAYVCAGETHTEIYAHEIGHALGVTHHNARGAGVMSAVLSGWGGCLTRRDAVLMALRTGERPCSPRNSTQAHPR